MEFIVSCCVYAFFCVICATVFILLGKIGTYRIKRHYQRKIALANLTENIITNVNALQDLEKKGRLDKYPEIHNYLMQNYVLFDKMFELRSVDFCKAKKVRENIKERRTFSDELCNCDDETILKLLNDTLCILKTLFKEKYPYRAVVLSIKKSVLCKILVIRLLFVVLKEIIRCNIRDKQDIEKRMTERKDDIKCVVDTSVFEAKHAKSLNNA
jgi:hypothetical protein